jgi:hypothetical protein
MPPGSQIALRLHPQAFAGIVTVSVGHCHPEVVKAVNAQNQLLQHTTTIYLNNQIAEYAKELADRMPGDLKVGRRRWLRRALGLGVWGWGWGGCGQATRARAGRWYSAAARAHAGADPSPPLRPPPGPPKGSVLCQQRVGGQRHGDDAGARLHGWVRGPRAAAAGSETPAGRTQAGHARRRRTRPPALDGAYGIVSPRAHRAPPRPHPPPPPSPTLPHPPPPSPTLPHPPPTSPTLPHPTHPPHERQL